MGQSCTPSWRTNLRRTEGPSVVSLLCARLHGAKGFPAESQLRCIPCLTEGGNLIRRIRAAPQLESVQATPPNQYRIMGYPPGKTRGAVATRDLCCTQLAEQRTNRRGRFSGGLIVHSALAWGTTDVDFTVDKENLLAGGRANCGTFEKQNRRRDRFTFQIQIGRLLLLRYR